MPEFPDIVVYIEALERRILDHRLNRVHLASPFLLRTAVPPIASVEGRRVVALRRIGKRICIGVEDDLWLVLHLMIAGRLHWKDLAQVARLRCPQTGSPAGVRAGRARVSASKTSKRNLATFEFENGDLTLTEAGTQKRASLHLVAGDAALRTLDPGGMEIFAADDPQAFAVALQSANHTLKRALTDPRLFSGIGNAYSDEILFAAQLSPIKLTQKLTAGEIEKLYVATRETLSQWVERLRTETGAGFPEGVTAFREEMAVHGRYKQPCRRCGAKIQRIRYASNETNYCPTCQTGGKLLADRALSRILREDWPRPPRSRTDIPVCPSVETSLSRSPDGRTTCQEAVKLNGPLRSVPSPRHEVFCGPESKCYAINHAKHQRLVPGPTEKMPYRSDLRGRSGKTESELRALR